jgi:hypothetical protein
VEGLQIALVAATAVLTESFFVFGVAPHAALRAAAWRPPASARVQCWLRVFGWPARSAVSAAHSDTHHVAVFHSAFEFVDVPCSQEGASCWSMRFPLA